MINDLLLAPGSLTVPGVNTKLGAIQDALRNRLVGQVVVATSPSTAGQAFTIPHTLGVIPAWACGVNDTGNVELGASDADVRVWTNTSITMRSPSASTRYRVLIVGIN